MRLAIVGTGYVGLTTGACFAELGHNVVCMDTDATKITALKSGQVPFHEPGLPELVRHNAAVGRLQFTSNLSDAFRDAEVVFLCVGTPARADGSADTSMLLDAARGIGRSVERPMIVVQKSTAPVGTLQAVHATLQAELQKRGLTLPVACVCNPEFLREGSAVEDFIHPARVVVGGSDTWAMERVASLYANLVPPERIFCMDSRSAEMAKYAANAFLAARISLINEIANLCEVLGADVEQVRQVVGADPRIGPSFLSPGVGYGGSCFPKDVKALIQAGEAKGYKPRVLRAVDAVNDSQRQRLVQRIAAAMAGNENANLSGRRVAIWGLARSSRDSSTGIPVDKRFSANLRCDLLCTFGSS